ncbi:MAG: hypothetical protein ACRDGI_08045, partial [Candidatus Limnocylindrales bacterium]
LRPTDGEIDPGLIQEILRLHREWLAGPTSPAIDVPASDAGPAAGPPPTNDSAPWHPDARSTSDMESDGA